MPQHPLRDDPARAGARAHFRAMGIDPERLDGPIVGIASTWTGTMPCNLTQRELADQVAEAVTAAGGVPLIFNTIAVSDNQTQATSGMRASLVSREVIADSIELMAIAHQFDALVCLTGCDKTTPAALMALARIDRPPSCCTAGRCGPAGCATARSRSATCGRRWRPRARAMERSELDEIERTRVRGRAPAPGSSPRTRWRSRSTASASRSSATG